MMYVEFMKNFVRADSARRCLLDSLRPPEPKNVWFLLSRHDVFGVHEKFSSSRFRRADACETDFDLLRAKTFCSYFLDMMYVEFKKNFLVADSGEQMPVDSLRPPEPKNVWFLLSRHDVLRVHEKFSSRRFRRADACQTHYGLLSPKTFDSYFLDMMYFEFMKNFLLADSGEQMPVRLISDSSAQKRLIPTFYMMYVEFMKNYFLADSVELMAVRLILASRVQNVWFQLSRHDVRRVHEKFSSQRFERADGY